MMDDSDTDAWTRTGVRVQLEFESLPCWIGRQPLVRHWQSNVWRAVSVYLRLSVLPASVLGCENVHDVDGSGYSL
jgi:hypothetical protein